MSNSNLKLIYIEGDSNLPHENIGYEEWLIKNAKKGEVILYLWQNEKTIVIGRNQNPWLECDVKKIKEDGVHLVRRLSGGGAVFHDLGNLNFTFIAEDEVYNIEKQFNVIIKALKKFGIKAYFSGRNDLLVDDKKISGNAFLSDNGFSFQHGTLLIDVDHDAMSKYLTPSKVKLNSKGITSVRSRTINLMDIAPTATLRDIKTAIFESFLEEYEYGSVNVLTSIKKNVEESEKFVDDSWNLGESPDFDQIIEDRFDWGTVHINIKMSGSNIDGIDIGTDCLFVEEFAELKNVLKDFKKGKNELCEIIENYNFVDKRVSEDLKGLIDKNLILQL